MIVVEVKFILKKAYHSSSMISLMIRINDRRTISVVFGSIRVIMWYKVLLIVYSSVKLRYKGVLLCVFVYILFNPLKTPYYQMINTIPGGILEHAKDSNLDANPGFFNNSLKAPFPTGGGGYLF